MTIWDMEKYPVELLEIMKSWTTPFDDDAFAAKISGKDVEAWIITYEDVVLNIDLLAERLASVLTSLQRLDPAHE